MAIAFQVRALLPEDTPFLWQMLYYAAHMQEDGVTSAQAAMSNPALAKYVHAWGQPGDIGFIALETTTAQPLGAAWARLFIGENKTYSQVDDQTPELAIAVLPAYLGCGIGTALLHRILQEARLQYPAIALNVRANNPALNLYQRLGFQVVGELINRVGQKSFDMRLTW